jgi:1-acyl-sn-glycerol-3-phosphate acyltransferase
MRVPPRPVRRLVVAPLVLAADVLILAASPLIALVAAILSPLAAARRALRALGIAVAYAARHGASVLACLVLWMTGGLRRADAEQTLRAHYAVLRWFVGGVHDSMTSLARVEVRIRDSDAAHDALAARRRPVVVLSRHAGEGDSLLVLHALLCRYGRRPRVVLHEALRLDPLIDVLGARLPNRFVDPRGGDTEVEIAAMAADLGPADALLIFPEGRNFSPARRARGIDRLEQAGHVEEAAWARAMTHVSAPRPGGALAALEAAPGADVVVVGHAGIPAGARDLWRRLGTREPIDLRLWLVPAAEIPAGRDERIDWLFGWWRELDRWVATRSSEPATLAPGPGF